MTNQPDHGGGNNNGGQQSIRCHITEDLFRSGSFLTSRSRSGCGQEIQKEKMDSNTELMKNKIKENDEPANFGDKEIIAWRNLAHQQHIISHSYFSSHVYDLTRN